MSELLLRNITKGSAKSFLKSYIKVIGIKNPKVLNTVIPDVTKNLSESSQAFFDALISKDADFIKETSTIALQRVLVPEITKLKQTDIEIKLVEDVQKNDQILSKLKDQLKKEGEKDLKMFTISPYVIFGQSMKERVEQDDPWKNIYRLLSFNRFLYVDPSRKFDLRKIRDDQVYGFHCHFRYISKNIQVTKNNASEEFKASEHVISFETDATNQEFFVSDYNYIVRDKSQ